MVVRARQGVPSEARVSQPMAHQGLADSAMTRHCKPSRACMRIASFHIAFRAIQVVPKHVIWCRHLPYNRLCNASNANKVHSIVTKACQSMIADCHCKVMQTRVGRKNWWIEDAVLNAHLDTLSYLQLSTPTSASLASFTLCSAAALKRANCRWPYLCLPHTTAAAL